MSADPTDDALEKPGLRALLDDAYAALRDDQDVNDLLPNDGKAVVLKPTRNPDDALASAALRVRVVGDSSERRNMATEVTALVQVQIDWTAPYHDSAGPTWEIDLRSAIASRLKALGGPARKPLGSGGDTNSTWSDQLGRYVGDVTYRYRVMEVQ